MVQVTCKYCGKTKAGVSPSNVKDINDYHCNSGICRSAHMKKVFEEKRRRGDKYVRGRPRGIGIQ